jgi:hypothetical protein
MAKQVVFIVTTDKDGNAEAQGFCKSHGPLDGQVKSIQYLTDNRVPFEPTVCFEFSGAESKVPVLKVEKVEALATWDIDAVAVLKMEPIKVVVTNGGKGRAGSFVVTCK